ncbi:hypothetical protein EV196_101345 [Mariniflexile fucanivorans]|uniref:OmpA family protein n=1 Tax=Mariniflexile fucanivorans TaxID=264023 RepID=A0A4R1RRJ9_9FLAO|nr:hypothetical protein [Mariniflexile fucanivorans]TCL68919.1 hypothetical protein EV196_101345 [Mariniflexile fucanivorans]
MKNRYLVFIACLLLGLNMSWSQNTYDIIFNAGDRDEKCKECVQAFRQKPKEVRYSIIRENDNLYFEVNDKNWFYLVFKNPDDGIAIDVVMEDRYKCDTETLSKNQIKGVLLKPVYSNELKSGLAPTVQNKFRVKVGKIPNGLLKEELEYNILFLGKKNLCQYYVTYDLEYYSWDLLDMGMYLDYLTYETKQIRSSNEKSSIQNKKLKFVVPFEKNKSSFSQSDIKPIYDTLRLTDFDIKTLNIKAYSSIEGTSNRNAELQQQRANSMVAALQKFQQPTIKTTVTSLENWVEFFNDIEGNKYEYLRSLNKNEIREKVVGAIANDLEPILKNHRKAVVELELEKKVIRKGESIQSLISEFNKAIADEKLDIAKELQNSIFEKMRTKEASITNIQDMVIPKQKKYAKFLNKNAAYKCLLDERLTLIAYNEMLELEKLLPKDAYVRYNLVAMEIKLWKNNGINVDESQIVKDINDLKNYGIDKSLISRMMVNFYIVIADKYMKNRDFDNKDKAIDYVNENYKKFSLSNYDYLSLAQFFSLYGNSNLAAKLLERKSRSIDIDEDLLFYYLNLTLIDKELTKETNYRTILLNAYNMNKERFCKLFNSVDDGGVTFQLLENEYLRKTYCDNCGN